jgi:hypothetical protein
MIVDKFRKWIVGPIAFGLAIFAVKYGQHWLRDNDPGLTGTVRSSFVESAIATCVKKQDEDPANKGISPSIISQYCNCYANGLADRVSNNELKSVATTPTVMMATLQPKIEAAAKPCLDAIPKQ